MTGASLRPLERSAPIPAALGRPSARDGEPSLLRRQLGVVREMLGTLETLTAAGQRYAMDKVVACLRLHAGCGSLALGPRNAHTLSQLLDELAREAQRLLPDPSQFSDRAEAMVTLMAAAA